MRRGEEACLLYRYYLLRSRVQNAFERFYNKGSHSQKIPKGFIEGFYSSYKSCRIKWLWRRSSKSEISESTSKKKKKKKKKKEEKEKEKKEKKKKEKKKKEKEKDKEKEQEKEKEKKRKEKKEKKKKEKKKEKKKKKKKKKKEKKAKQKEKKKKEEKKEKEKKKTKTKTKTALIQLECILRRIFSTAERTGAVLIAKVAGDLLFLHVLPSAFNDKPTGQTHSWPAEAFTTQKWLQPPLFVAQELET